MKLEALRTEALKLPDSERADLASDLLRSLDSDCAAEIDCERLWEAELQRRHQAFEDGKAEFRPAAEVIASLRAKYL